MFLTRLIYASKVAADVNRDDLDQIIESACKNNAELGVTGALVFSNKYFLQVLEGGRSEVNTVYHKILADKRHYEPTLLDYSEISQRMFHEWEMKLFLETNINRKTNIKYFSQENFDPYEISGKTAAKLLQDITSKDHMEK